MIKNAGRQCVNSKLVKAAVTVLVPVAILLVPVPTGLPVMAWKLFALYIGAILGLMLRPLPEPAILLTAIAISSLWLNNVGEALAGYASTTTWLVFTAFMVGQAFNDTGLGKRIAFILIGKMGRTTLGLGYVAALTDFVLCPATPSTTARTGGLVFPIFQSVALTLGSQPGPTSRRIGAYLALLLYQVSMATGALFITALATHPLILTFAKNILKVEVSWMQWAQAALVPGLIVLAVTPYLVYKMFPPEIKVINNKEIASKGMAEIGPMSGKEKILALLFILAVLGWATGQWTKINSTAVAVGFVAGCLVTGVVSWESLLRCKGAWSTLIWYGGIISFAGALGKAGFFTWFAKILGQNINFTGYSDFSVLGGLLALSVVVRYFFASQAAYVSSLIPVFFTIGLLAKAPLLPMVMLLGVSSAFGSQLTHYGNAVGPVLFGADYVDQGTWWKVGTVMVLVNCVIYMGIGLPY
jgi:DASS family divalent anion:Na+ symporter